ncbi:MAG: TldD/PmbA family protein [Bacilli bacterium]|nr:TldD/PmbA family protein [Bacilli bacterium]
MDKQYLEKLLDNMLSTGADFAEIFEENTISKSYNYIDSKLDNIRFSQTNGIGLRIAKNTEIYYASINYDDLEDVYNLSNDLKNNINDKVLYKNIKLNDLEKYKADYKISYDDYSDEKIKEYMSKLDKKIRNLDKRVNQVSLTLMQRDDNVTISNYKGIYKKEQRYNTRFYVSANFKDGENVASSSFNWGSNGGLEILEKNIDKELDKLIKFGVDKLYAKPCIGKKMPVILGPGFGAVIFHEACGHAMEANATANNQSVLAGKIGQKVANDKVTIIDDGTISNLWGTTKIDDEGMPTQKNVLIKDGVLVNYLNDEINNRKLNMQLTGSSRREDYHYAPVSRMNNTYLLPRDDKIEDMIKSIDFGLYAFELGGGSVDTESGDFNFGCETAYMIRNGKIAECVKGASLIGNALDILNNVEMVSDNLEYGVGMCGASSGWVYVTIGEPTIKVSSILVGGEEDDK